MMRKHGLLIGCAAGALLAAAAAPASAQSFNGTPTVAAGAATISTGVNTTTVTVTAPETVINWQTVDVGGTGAINFQPVGTTATFQTGAPPLADYTVLNRVLPVDIALSPTSATVTFNGTVNSTIVNNPGGHIWFYSPTGIIVSPTAQFTVGSLILTTGDIPFVAGGAGSVYGPGGLVKITSPAGSAGFVEIQPGAQITAAGASNAYVALVAPRVVQSGLVQANGQIAYLAAEQVDLTINAGLFDFVLNVGTTDPEGVVHTGNTTGPASTSAADLQRISMVALPKNTALTMMLSGSVGYTPAASAANEGSSVVLAAGFSTDDPTALPGNALGNILIGNSQFRNQLTAYASSTVEIDPAAGTAGFLADAQLYGLDLAGIDAGTSESVLSTGNLSLYAGRPGAGGAIGISAQGKGAISVAGELLADASSSAAQFVAAPVFLSAVGGTVSILADGGTIGAASLTARAGAKGGFGAAAGGDALGGTIAAGVINGGTIASSAVAFGANAAGGNSNTLGGLGTGGSLLLNATGGALNFGSVTLAADGAGGASSGDAGNGIGGTVAIGIASGTHTWNSLVARADATGGVQLVPGTGNAGSATGGRGPVSLDLTNSDTALTILNDATLSADTFIGIDGQPGFTGQAGGVAINLGPGTTLSVGGALSATADARIDGSVTDFGPDRSATQIGGGVDATVNGGTLSASNLSFSANAVGLSGTTAAGTATGGTVSLTAQNTGSVSIADGLNTSLVSLNADATGSPGPLPADAQGGTVKLVARDSSIFVTGNVQLSANAAMGPFLTLPADGAGFNATGGTVTIDQPLGPLGTASIDATLTIEAAAIGDARVILAGGTSPPGGEALLGTGGTGTGGTVTLTENAGTLSATALRLLTDGYGGASAATGGATPFQSGAGFGGSSEMVQNGGTAQFTTLELYSDGLGGGGGPAAAGLERAALAGNGTGGSSLLTLNGGTLDVTDTALGASGAGADGMDSGNRDASDGGIGTGGTIQLLVPAGWAGEFNSNSTLFMTANGTGGVGGAATGAGLDPPTASNADGGDGIGGTITVNLADGQLNFGPTRLEAVGTGGYSGDASSGIPGGFGGVGFGGSIGFDLTDSPAGPLGARTIGGLFLNTDGIGGFGSVFLQQSIEGVLTLNIDVFDATTPLGLPGYLELLNRANGFPGPVGIGVTIAGAPLTVGGGTVINSTRDLVIVADEPLHGLNDVALTGGTVTTTGLVRADGSLYVGSYYGTDAETLVAGGSTDLDSFNGPILVHNLSSFGPVQADGASVDIGSPGALAFDHIVAFAGPIVVHTVGNLDLVTAEATGALTLTSATGAVTGTGAITSGAATIDAPTGVTLVSLAAGGATQLTSGGTVDVDALASTGPVDVTANAVDIDGVGALTFTTAQATTTMRIVTTGDLAFAAVDAGSDLTLGSTLGSLSATGNVSGGPVALGAGTDIDLAGNLTAAGPLTVDALGAFTVAGNTVADSADIDADGGIALASLASGGTTALRAINGPVTVTSLSSADDVTALGSTVDLTAPGALAVASAQANAGDLHIVAGGNLTSALTQATGAIDLRSTGGALAATGPVVAGGALALAGNTGITGGTVTSGGTTLLQSANGGVTVTALGSTGAVTAQGRFVDIASPGALSFADARATAGPVQIDTQGNLALAQGGASAGLFLTSANGAITGTGLLTAGNNASLVAPLGVTLTSLTVGGTTLLRATGGPVVVTSLTSGGLVTAFGRTVDIVSPGALTFADLDATAGPLSVVTAGNLTLVTADATGAMTLRSTSGSVGATGAVASGGAFSADAQTGLSFVALNSAGSTSLQAPGGLVDVDELRSTGPVTARGRSVDIVSSAALAFADIDLTPGFLGTLVLRTAGNLTLATVDAPYTASLTSTGGSVVATGLVNLGGGLTASGATGVSFASLTLGTAGGNTSLLSTGGPIRVDQLLTPNFVMATGRSLDIASTGPLNFALTQATGGDVSLRAGGRLFLTTVDATGAIALASTGAQILSSGLLSSGGAFSAAAATDISLSGVTSGGTARFDATAGYISLPSLRSTGAVTARGAGMSIASDGGLTIANLSATAGSVLVDVAGNLSVATADATDVVDLRSSGGTLTTTGVIKAGGRLALNGAGGLTAGTVMSGATTQLQSPNGAITVSALSSSGAVSATAGDSLFIDGTGPLTFATAKALNAISVITSGNLAFDTVDAGYYLTLHATDGSLTTAGDVTGLFPDIRASGDIRIGGDLHSLGSLSVNGGGSFTVVGDTFSDDASISAVGGIAMTSLHAGERTNLIATNGLIVVPELTTGVVVARGLDVDIGSSGSLNFAEASASADDVTIRTAGDLRASLLTARDAIDLDVGGTFTLDSLARGVTIAVLSNDIVIGAALGTLGTRGVPTNPPAALGARGTTLDVTLTNRDPARTTIVGGAADSSGYSLDQAEVARVFADRSITLTSGGDFAVHDLALTYSATGQLGAGGELEITTPGRVSITGTVNLTTGSATDTFTIDPRRIELTTDTGSIAMLDAGGTPQGRLALIGDTVAVATGATLGQLATATDFAAINALLDQPGGTPQPLRAGTMTFDVIDALYIQNTGPTALYRDRAGFTANSAGAAGAGNPLDPGNGVPAGATGGVAISTESGSTRIAINGQILTPGGALTGLETQQGVTINGKAAATGGQFDPGSTINGCVIGARCGPPPGAGAPSDSDLQQPLPPDTSPPSLFVAPIIQLAGSDPLVEPPLVDEPITGIGNDDLWEPHCAPDKEPCPGADERP